MRTPRSRLDVQHWRLLQRLLTIAAILVVCALAASILTAPVERLVLLVPDDAFYYLQIARNLVATGRSTADGFSATNGYHPLWLAVLTPLAAVSPDREWLLRAAVGVAFLLHLVASWLVGVRVTEAAGRTWGRTAAVCWLLNPVALLLAFHAMESTLYVVLLLVCLGVHLRLARTIASDERPPLRLSIFYGAALGLASLARTEGAMVAIIALVWLAVRLWRTSTRRTDVAVSWILCATTMALIVAPWLLFSRWQVGTIQQDSAVMKALWATDRFPNAASRLRNLLDTADYFFRYTLRLIVWSLPGPVLTVVPIALAALFVGTQWQRPRGRIATALRGAVVPATIVAVMYGFTLVERQIWWLGLPWLTMFLTAILGAAWLCREITAARRRQRVVRGALLAGSALAFLVFARGPRTPYVWQADVLRSQAAIEQSIPPDQRIGCFNAGIPLYFGTGRIVALDGLASHAAREYWSARRFDDYLRDARVRYIADARWDVDRAQRFSRAPLRLEQRLAFPLRGLPAGERLLWSVEPADAPTTHP